MHIGETVEAMVNGGQWCNGQVIAIYKDSVTVSGEAELALSAASGRPPLGICLPMSLIRAKEKGKNSLLLDRSSIDLGYEEVT